MSEVKNFADKNSLKKNLFNTTDEAALNNGFFSGKLDAGKAPISIPQISMPKGGGAIRGIDEKFEINAANGTASFSIPLPITPGRNGIRPSLSLSYNSGGGNGAFGLGWNIDTPFIQRRTDKKLPQYRDDEESDVFIFSGAEDLQPFVGEKDRYRPRVEGAFSRIERIGLHWKLTSSDNTVTLFGIDAHSRIADPVNEEKIFKWLPSFTYNDKGDWTRYIYREENTENVPDSAAEKNRLNGRARFTNRYLHRVEYGNRLPYYPEGPTIDAPGPHFFEVVLDYGDPWECRPDPFSDYHAGFEIRTYRLCKRILMFHRFEELGNEPALVSSLNLHYQTRLSEHPEQPTEITYLRSVTQTGHAGDLDKSLPPMEFSYEELKWDTRIKAITPDNIVNAPVGLTDNYEWTDLYGEGISGILTEQGEGWYYKHNEGGGHFTPAMLVTPKPSFKGLAKGALQLTDLNADGYRQIVSMEHGHQGYFTLLDDNEWDIYRPFESTPEVDLHDPYLRMIDLDGDGRADLLITEENIFRWYPSLGTKGYAPLETVSLSLDEEDGPRIVFADPEQTIFLADMSGDGLTDIVRIRNGSTCYWPNKGYGKFGAKVEMNNAPWFDYPDLFNPAYIYLADISGTGATDILYLGGGSFMAWLNFSGNGWSAACRIDPFFSTALPDKISVVDLLGNGTACIVWSSPLPSNAGAPMRYIDLMGGRKPHVMISHINHCGSETRLTYTSSTVFYLADKKSGHPWVTKLPFPVQCVSKKEVWEKVTNTYFVNEYDYHHGYYDHPEREFRGFGRVDQTDTQRFDNGVPLTYANYEDPETHEPPVLTRTWFHLGAYLHEKKILDHFRHEYWHEEEEYKLPDAVLIGDFNDQELREAHRACKGMVLRQEIYALDGSLKEPLPFTVTERNCHIKMLQPVDGNRYAVFMVQDSEAITYSYERVAKDPRVSHTLNIEIDDLGNVLRSASIVYPRRHRPEGMTDGLIWAQQHKRHILLSERTFTRDIISEKVYRLRMLNEVRTYEVGELRPAEGCCEAPAAPYLRICDLQHVPDKKLIDHLKNSYLSEDLVHPLPEGVMGALGLLYETYQLAVTDGMLQDIFRRDDRPLIQDISSTMKNAGYVDVNDNGQWWIRSGRMIFEDAAKARATFYLPAAFEDQFGARTTVKYNPYQLFITETIDAVGNRVSILRFNFRNLSPELIKDINDNHSVAVYDELGLVTATALQGKAGAPEGDLIDDTVRPFLPEEEIASFFETPTQEKGSRLLGHATTRVLYDYQVIPVRTAIISRERHVSDLGPGEVSGLQFSFEYSGGTGTSVLKKEQAPPGPDRLPRWIGSGRTVLNNKGKPVKQYEPYFSHTHLCETEDLMVNRGVSHVMHYDPMGRVIRVDLPDQTFTETRFDNWWQEVYDTNDTVLRSRWYAERIGGTYDRQDKDPILEKQAAEKAAVHAGTCATVYLDSLGRAVVIKKFNKWQGTRLLSPGEAYTITRMVLDVKGYALEVIDPRDNQVARYRYDVQGQMLYQEGMDSGKRWMLNTCMGKPLHTWDSRDQQFSLIYDALHRPVEVRAFTKYHSPDPKDEKAMEITLSKMFYGTYDPGTVAANLNGQPIAKYDTAGVGRLIRADFKGNILSSSHCLCRHFKVTPDWSDATVDDPHLPMAPEVFANQVVFDALNRPVTLYAPHTDIRHANIISPSYNETNLLKSLQGRLRDAAPSVTFIKDIDYDARGQRKKIVYGNESSTRFTYDEENFRLLRLQTRAKGEAMQLLSYTYDPTGNVTHIKDDAFQPVYFRNHVVDPGNDYTYDAFYRLIQGEGREFGPQNIPVTQYDRTRETDTAIPFHNAKELQRYSQCYAYDGVGNMLQLSHAPASGTGWKRDFSYNAHNNQLTATALGLIGGYDRYGYDPHGNMLNLDALQSLYWDCKDRLAYAGLSASREHQPDQQVWYNYDGDGQRMRKVVQRKNRTEETIYLGGLELFREYRGNAEEELPERERLVKERETLHVMDDTRKIALVETLTVAKPNDDEPKQLIRYQYSNHLGSASLELDETGHIISYEEFYPFGSTSFLLTNKEIRSAAKRYRYIGKERDEESGLNYHGARYYAPWLCRWTAADPVGIKDDLNVYSYVRNSPTSKVDISGKWEEDMHFIAIYWSARVAGESHYRALVAAVASESLDDRNSTAAPATKAAGAALLTSPFTYFWGRSIISEANNRHSLGLTFKESQSVADEGTKKDDIVLFGLGMHTVGDFLPHANLTGKATPGHQEGLNEDGSESHWYSTWADHTARNPSKALSTFKIFLIKWNEFRGHGQNEQYTSSDLAAIDTFIKAGSDDKAGKLAALKEGMKRFNLTDKEFQEVSDLYLSKKERLKIWDGLAKDPGIKKMIDLAKKLWQNLKSNGDFFNSTVTKIPPEYTPPTPVAPSPPPPPAPPAPPKPGLLERAYDWLDRGVRGVYGLP